MAEAVIIVPGIGGNELWTPQTFFGWGPRQRIWLDHGALLAGGWRLLGLSDDLLPDVPGQGVLEAGACLSHYYGTLIEHLRRWGYTVQSAILEWRGPLVYDGKRLADQTKALFDAGFSKVHWVCHSRGGLVARAAWPLIQGYNLHYEMGRVITLGAPHFGSWSAAGMLAGWENTCWAMGLILGGIGRWTGLAYVTGPIRDTMDTWPGAYELLPSPTAPGIPADRVSAIYSAETWSAAGVRIRPKWLTAAQATWAALPQFAFPAKVVQVCGYSGMTAVDYYPPGAVTSSKSYGFSGDGDGVVPLPWARLPQYPALYTPTAHSALNWDARILERLPRYLSEGLTSDETISGPYVEPGLLG